MDRAASSSRGLSGAPAAAPLLLVGCGLALAALLPWRAGWMLTLAAIVLLGVPHGALDGEIARGLLRPRLGRAWFPAFAMPYLALSACVLIAWDEAPLWTLAGFLAASVWHFGTEDAVSGDRLDAVVRGGLPIAAPALAHPAATAAIFGAVAASPLPQLPEWLWAASLCWAAAAIVWSVAAVSRGQASRLRVPGALACLFLALPPLTGFAIYFVCVHAPAHTGAMIHDARRAPRVHDERSAARLAAPITALTVLIGAALWPLYDGEPATRLLTLTVQALAALTLPHMLLGAWASRAEVEGSRC